MNQNGIRKHFISEYTQPQRREVGREKTSECLEGRFWRYAQRLKTKKKKICTQILHTN